MSLACKRAGAKIGRAPPTLAIQEQHVILIPGSRRLVKPRGSSLQPHSDVVLPGKFLTHVEPKC